MTIPATGNRKDYIGDGTTTAFSFPYLFLSDSSLKVYVNGGTPKTITTDYTVSGTGTGAGSVTFVVAPASGAAIAIVREEDYTQEASYPTVTNFPSKGHEAALDKLTILAQQLKEITDRCLKLNEAEAATTAKTELASATDRAGKIPLFTESSISYVSPSDLALSASIPTGAPNRLFGYDGSGSAGPVTVSSNFTLSGSNLSLNSLPNNVVTTASVVNAAITEAKLDALLAAKVNSVGGATELLATATASSSASLDFTTGFSSDYSNYFFLINGLVFSASTSLFMRTSQNAGVSFESGASDYHWGRIFMTSGGVSFSVDTSDSEITLAASSSVGLDGVVKLHNPLSTSLRTRALWDFTNDTYQKDTGGGERLSAVTTNAIRFLPGSGTFTSGTIRMYGVRNA